MNNTGGSILAFVLVIALSASGCCQRQIVAVGSPFDRYDHNRTRPIDYPLSEKVEPRKVDDEVYTPMGSEHFPKAYYAGAGPAPDKLPAANIVPVFTGLPLPLSSAAVKEGDSDRQDLLDYLASGPLAKAAVEMRPMAGDSAAAEISYRPVLELLSSKERLAQNKRTIRAQITGSEDTCTVGILDGRYDDSSFADILAMDYGDFTFILYKAANLDYFSRLVVVPLFKRGQDFPGKRP